MFSLAVYARLPLRETRQQSETVAVGFDSAMPDDPPLDGLPPPPPTGPKRCELLFEFVRPHDRAPIDCELRFHGESYGWVQFLDRDGLWLGHGAFVARGG